MPVIIFNSTSQALLAERALEDGGLDIDIVPLPRGFSADCGLAIEFAEGDEPKVRALLAERRLEHKGIYKL